MEKIFSWNTGWLHVSWWKFRQVIPGRTKTGYTVHQFCLHCHIHCLSWIIWVICICHQSKNKRDWNKKSIGGKCQHHCHPLIKRFFKVGSHCCIACFSRGLVFYEQLVAGFCLSYQYAMVGICNRRHCCCIYCIGDDKFSSD